LVLYGVGGVVLLVLGILIINFGMIYIRALFSGAKVTITELIALRLRRIPLGLIVDGRITAVKSGLPVSIDELSTHFLAGGNVQMVVLALVAAKKAGINLIFDRACAIDLATKGTGKTVLEAVKTSVNPKVIDCPAPASGKSTIDAVAKDGIVIKAKARVTVRSNRSPRLKTMPPRSDNHGSEHDGRHPNTVVGVNVRAGFQQHPRGVHIAVIAGEHEQRPRWQQQGHTSSKRSRFITLFQAATKSWMNFVSASELP